MTQRIPPEVAAQVTRLFVEESAAVFVSALRATRGDRCQAEDLVQEAFQAAALQWDAITGYSPDRKRAWLRRVAKNKAIDHYRSEGSLQLDNDLAVERETPTAEYAVLTRIAKDRCLKEIGDMPDARKKVAYLKFHEEWDNREIAQYLGISTSTVRVHLHHARTRLEAAVWPELFLTDEPDKQADSEADWEEAP